MDTPNPLGTFLRENGIPSPPVPARLQRECRAVGRYGWASREIDTFEMYMFFDGLMELFRRPVIDYVAVGYDGYGSNSFAITYFLIHGRLAVFAQSSFGGVYTSTPEFAEAVSQTFESVAGLLATLEEQAVHAGGDPPGAPYSRTRHVVVCSDMRDCLGYAVVPRLPALVEGVVSVRHTSWMSGGGRWPICTADGQRVDWTTFSEEAELFAHANEELRRPLAPA